MLKTFLDIEHYRRDGRLLRHIHQPSRSWVRGLLDILYVQTSQGTLKCRALAYGYIDIAPGLPVGANPMGQVTAGWGLANLRVWNESVDFGDIIGICVGSGNAVENSGHLCLDAKLGQTAWTPLRVVVPADSTKTWYGMACDGTYVYLVNDTDDKVHKVNAFTGVEAANFATPFANPIAICYDPTNDKLWGLSANPTNKVWDMNKTTGANTTSWNSGVAGTGITFEWTNNYVCVISGALTFKRWSTAGVAQADGNLPVIATGFCYNGTTMYCVAGTAIYEATYPGGVTVKVSNNVRWAQGQLQAMGFESPYVWIWQATGKSAHRMAVTPSGMEITPAELADWDISAPDASFLIRAFVTNNSGGALTINEIGLQGHPYGILYARDVIGGGLPLLNGEMAKISYQLKITV